MIVDPDNYGHKNRDLFGSKPPDNLPEIPACHGLIGNADAEASPRFQWVFPGDKGLGQRKSAPQLPNEQDLPPIHAHTNCICFPQGDIKSK